MKHLFLLLMITTLLMSCGNNESGSYVRTRLLTDSTIFISGVETDIKALYKVGDTVLVDVRSSMICSKAPNYKSSRYFRAIIVE